MQPSVIINVLEKLLKYLDPLLPTVNCHMVDFYTCNIYEKHVPLKIRNEMLELDCDGALNAIWDPSEYKELNSFIQKSKQHNLPNFPEVCLNIKGLEQKLIKLGCNNLSGFHLEHFMSHKKSHEVEILSEIASAVNQIANTSHIVDIGDGKGYLSSALVMHNNIKVLGIDSSVVNTIGAAKRVAKLNRVLGKTIQVVNNELYKQTTQFVTEETNLSKLVKENFPMTDCDELGLVGLHTCGDLGPSCLRIFHSNANIKTLCNVGCCYHLLTEETNHSSGFPMSDYLNQKGFKLGRNARMVAAQSLDRMIYNKERPSDILFYRSLLQVLLLKHAPDLLICQAGRFKKPTTFIQYIEKTLKKFNSNLVVTKGEITELYDSYLARMVELQVFYLLRAHLAPVVEAVILLDRLLYLSECGYDKSYLVQLFDPVISPRCYGLVVFK